MLAGFNSGEIRSLTLPGAAAAGERRPRMKQPIRDRYGDLADEFLRLYPSTNMQESMLATTRDALYGWTAERLARKQTAVGAPSYLYLFDHGYPATDKRGPARFPRQRTALRVRQHRPHAAALAEDSDDRCTSARCPTRWSAIGRASRAPAQPVAANAPDWPAYGSQRLLTWLSPMRRIASRHLMPGMYELHEEAMCRRRASGRSAVELECRASSRRR